MRDLLGFVLIICLTLFFVFFFLILPASAHDFWIDGKKVDPVTKRLCCGENDCKVIEPGDVTEVPGGFAVDMTPAFGLMNGTTHKTVFIKSEQTQPSQDGKRWLCYWDDSPKCFFMPMSF